MQGDIADIISQAQSRNIRHEAAEVARTSLPFEDQDDHHAFIIAMSTALEDGAYPAGFHLNDEYEVTESFKTGRSVRPLEIPLPHDIWFPRIVVWCKGLDLLKRFPLSKAMAVQDV